MPEGTSRFNLTVLSVPRLWGMWAMQSLPGSWVGLQILMSKLFYTACPQAFITRLWISHSFESTLTGSFQKKMEDLLILDTQQLDGLHWWVTCCVLNFKSAFSQTSHIQADGKGCSFNYLFIYLAVAAILCFWNLGWQHFDIKVETFSLLHINPIGMSRSSFRNKRLKKKKKKPMFGWSKSKCEVFVEIQHFQSKASEGQNSYESGGENDKFWRRSQK